MHQTQSFTIARQLDDDSILEISMSFRISRSTDGHLRVAAVDSAPVALDAGVAPAEAQTDGTRLSDETDAQYLQRLITMDRAEPRILSRWAKHLKVSLRRLNQEKKAGRIAYAVKGETRAGNAHLITVTEMIKTVERLSLAA